MAGADNVSSEILRFGVSTVRSLSWVTSDKLGLRELGDKVLLEKRHGGAGAEEVSHGKLGSGEE